MVTAEPVPLEDGGILICEKDGVVNIQGRCPIHKDAACLVSSKTLVFSLTSMLEAAEKELIGLKVARGIAQPFPGPAPQAPEPVPAPELPDEVWIVNDGTVCISQEALVRVLEGERGHTVVQRARVVR